MTTTIPYSVRIPKDLLDEMKRHFDRMSPPKPTFSAILSHIVKMGWETYLVSQRDRRESPPPLIARYPKRLGERDFKTS